MLEQLLFSLLLLQGNVFMKNCVPFKVLPNCRLGCLVSRNLGSTGFEGKDRIRIQGSSWSCSACTQVFEGLDLKGFTVEG